MVLRCFGEKQLNQKRLYILGDPVLCFIWIYLNVGPVIHNHPLIWNDWMALSHNCTHHSSPLTFFLLAVTGHLCQVIVSNDAEDSFKTPKELLVLWLRRVGQLVMLFPKETHNFDTEHGDSMVVKLVFKQQHFIKKHDLLASLQLLQVNSFCCLCHLQMRR